MAIFVLLRTAQAQAVAARDFEAPFAVTIPLTPGYLPDQHLLDRATTFALDPARLGRSRRAVDARAGEATWCFENGDDATEFAFNFP